MKISLVFILTAFSFCQLQAQQDTSTTIKANKIRYNYSGAFWEYGIDNQCWSEINHLLNSYGYTGKFNDFSFTNFGLGIGIRYKKFGMEFSFHSSDQSYTESSRYYNTTFGSYKIRGYYAIFDQHRVIASILSGINIQMMSLKIDSIYNSPLLINYYSSNLKKTFLYIPIGLDFKYRVGEKSRKNTKSSNGLFVGIRACYHIPIYQFGWYQNEQRVSFPDLTNRGYFETTVTFGLY